MPKEVPVQKYAVTIKLMSEETFIIAASSESAAEEIAIGMSSGDNAELWDSRIRSYSGERLPDNV